MWPLHFVKAASLSLDSLSLSDHPGHYEDFVARMNGHFMEQVSKLLGLVNAQQVIYHSIIPSTDKDLGLIQVNLDSPGEAITLAATPNLINVIISALAQKLLSPDQIKMLLKLLVSSTKGEILIPISPQASTKNQ